MLCGHRASTGLADTVRNKPKAADLFAHCISTGEQADEGIATRNVTGASLPLSHPFPLSFPPCTAAPWKLLRGTGLPLHPTAAPLLSGRTHGSFQGGNKKKKIKKVKENMVCFSRKKTKLNKRNDTSSPSPHPVASKPKQTDSLRRKHCLQDISDKKKVVLQTFPSPPSVFTG